MTADEVLAEICKRAGRMGVAVNMSPAVTVDCDGVEVAGFFDDDTKLLKVAGGRAEREWLGVLLHEYSHACQWFEGATIWSAALRGDGMWEWLDGKPAKNARKMVEATRDMEADCERRTMRLIVELGAPIDLAEYCRSANAYVHFYNVVADTRKWYAPGRGPYEDAVSKALANTTIDKDFSKTPAKLRKALEDCVQ